MNSRKEIAQAKRLLETAERRLVDARTMRERLTRVIPGASDEFRPTLVRALSTLTAVTPRLEREFDQAFDALNALSFVADLDWEVSRPQPMGASPRYRSREGARRR